MSIVNSDINTLLQAAKNIQNAIDVNAVIIGQFGYIKLSGFGKIRNFNRLTPKICVNLGSSVK